MRKKIILASKSPRRKQLLKELFKNFKVSPSLLDESKITAKSPEAFALKAAIAKAEDVALKHKSSIIIGADTIVVLGKTILGKPKSKKEALSTLKKLAGRTHKVITGVAVIDSDSLKTYAGYEVTKVKMKKVSSKEIDAYVRSGRPLDKAGSYGIQEIEEVFINKIEGDYENVVGLPLNKLKKLLSML
jgi:septum formation protein